jgi:hypothetical protein
MSVLLKIMISFYKNKSTNFPLDDSLFHFLANALSEVGNHNPFCELQ